MVRRHPLPQQWLFSDERLSVGVARLAALKTRQGTLYRPKLSSLRQFWEESHPEDVDI